MRNFKAILFFIFLGLFSLVSGQQSISSLEGIFYLDNKPISVKISEGKITKIDRLSSDTDLPEVFIAPGLIDIQINGYMGVDFTGEDLTIEGVRKVTKALWKEGVTSYLPTVITYDHDRYLTNFAILAEAKKDKEIGWSIPGFHLEGPYISPIQGYRGAHLEKYIRPPDWEEFSKYQKAADNNIKMITVAPEMDGAIPFIQKLTEHEVCVSLGHHNGSSVNIRDAVDAGASLSTHLGNGCANMINRHYNPIWPQLADDRLSITLIVDGFHLTEEEVRSFYKVKGVQNTILVSDALDLAGLEPGEYVRGERTVLLTPNVIKFPAENVLAGAASPVRICVGNMIRFTGCSLKDAIQMSSSNPAKHLNLENVGEISPGKLANLILFTIEKGEMVVQKTIVAGKIVYTKN